MVHTGLVVPSSSWSLRSPAAISTAPAIHLSTMSWVSEGCLTRPAPGSLTLVRTPPLSHVSRLALGSLHRLW